MCLVRLSHGSRIAHRRRWHRRWQRHHHGLREDLWQSRGRRAVGNDSRELHGSRGGDPEAACRRRRRDGPRRRLASRRGHAHGHDGRLTCRRARGGRVCSLAAVVAMTELVVVEATGKLRLLEMSGDMLVGHLLHASLQEVQLLYDLVSACVDRSQCWSFTHLVLTPSPTSTRRGRFARLGHAVLVPARGIRSGNVGSRLRRQVHGGRHVGYRGPHSSPSNRWVVSLWDGKMGS